MKLEYYKGKIPNFGDDLNAYLWPNIFKKQFDNKIDEIPFYGIGTIIDQRIAPQKKNIIFGTGIRNATYKYDTKLWDIFFVRGPISSNILGGAKYITDSAYCLKFHPKGEYFLNLTTKKHKIGIIPHFLSLPHLNWESICNKNNAYFIDPTKNVEQIIEDIASCEQVLTEAMHGAIIADFLRVPWHRYKYYSHFYEGEVVSEIKWTDWLSSIGINDTYESRINFYETRYSKNLSSVLKKRVQSFLFKKLLHNNSIQYYLSNDAILQQKYDELDEVINKLKSKY